MVSSCLLLLCRARALIAQVSRRVAPPFTTAAQMLKASQGSGACLRLGLLIPAGVLATAPCFAASHHCPCIECTLCYGRRPSPELHCTEASPKLSQAMRMPRSFRLPAHTHHTNSPMRCVHPHGPTVAGGDGAGPARPGHRAARFGRGPAQRVAPWGNHGAGGAGQRGQEPGVPHAGPAVRCAPPLWPGGG